MRVPKWFILYLRILVYINQSRAHYALFTATVGVSGLIVVLVVELINRKIFGS